MSSAIPSVRDLARALDLSPTTVSWALRNKPSVKLQTRQRVLAAAAAAGYRSNPLAGSLMTEMRRKRGASFRGGLAIIDLDGPEGRPPAAAAYHRELTEGACERAAELGFKPRMFCGHNGNADGHIIEELGSLKIHGALFLPVLEIERVAWSNWSRCACVYADYLGGVSTLHNICPDHFFAMRTALRQLRALGYKRPGLVLEECEETRLSGRWGDAFWMLQAKSRENPEIPPLVMSGAARDEFCAWFQKHDPDVVIGHSAEIMDWMRSCGAHIPDTHGFCCLNIIKNPDMACAGLDQQSRLIGARAVEFVIAQLQRGEYGPPSQPLNITIPSVWIGGPTLRISPKIDLPSESTCGHTFATR